MFIKNIHFVTRYLLKVGFQHVHSPLEGGMEDFGFTQTFFTRLLKVGLLLELFITFRRWDISLYTILQSFLPTSKGSIFDQPHHL